MTLDSLADHLDAQLQEQGITRCHLVGHSLGGKVAITLAGRASAQDRSAASSTTLASLIVLDIAPKHYEAHHRPLLDAMRKLDISNLESRSDADAALRNSIAHAGTRAFLLKSLSRHGDRWDWQFDLERLSRDYAHLTSPPPYREDDAARGRIPALFVRALESDYVSDDDAPLIRRYFPDAQLRAISASHWLHAEKPAQVAELCETFVAAIKA